VLSRGRINIADSEIVSTGITRANNFLRKIASTHIEIAIYMKMVDIFTGCPVSAILDFGVRFQVM